MHVRGLRPDQRVLELAALAVPPVLRGILAAEAALLEGKIRVLLDDPPAQKEVDVAGGVAPLVVGHLQVLAPLGVLAQQEDILPLDLDHVRDLGLAVLPKPHETNQPRQLLLSDVHLYQSPTCMLPPLKPVAPNPRTTGTTRPSRRPQRRRGSPAPDLHATQEQTRHTLLTNHTRMRTLLSTVPRLPLIRIHKHPLLIFQSVSCVHKRKVHPGLVRLALPQHADLSVVGIVHLLPVNPLVLGVK